MKFPMIMLATLAIAGCQNATLPAPPVQNITYENEEHGVVDANHPAYQAADALCDARVYGPGFEVDGVTYTSRQAVFDEVIAPISRNISKTQAELETLIRWSGGIQSEFIACIQSEGFFLVTDEGS